MAGRLPFVPERWCIETLGGAVPGIAVRVPVPFSACLSPPWAVRLGAEDVPLGLINRCKDGVILEMSRSLGSVALESCTHNRLTQLNSLGFSGQTKSGRGRDRKNPATFPPGGFPFLSAMAKTAEDSPAKVRPRLMASICAPCASLGSDSWSRVSNLIVHGVLGPGCFDLVCIGS